MSNNFNCDLCNNNIKKNNQFVNNCDERLYGYPKFLEIDLYGNKRQFSYDSDEEENNLCFRCKIEVWFKVNISHHFKKNSVPEYRNVLELFENTFLINLINDNITTEEKIIKDILYNLYKSCKDRIS